MDSAAHGSASLASWLRAPDAEATGTERQPLNLLEQNAEREIPLPLQWSMEEVILLILQMKERSLGGSASSHL